MNQVPVLEVRPNTPPSKAVQAVRKQLTPKSQTPRFDPEFHKLEKDSITDRQQREDSFEVMIESRTPMKITQSESLEVDTSNDTKVKELDKTEEDDFVKHIVARSPVRPMARIEDSVEAIDALEDAIEKVGESIPLLEDPPESPIKVPRSRKVPAKTIASGSKVTKKAALSKVNKEPATSRLSTIHNKTPGRRSPTKPISAAQATAEKSSSQPGAAQRPSTRSGSATIIKAPASVKPPRVASITKAPFVPSKSAKPPTRSTFSLPGEAISQKLKQQREERLKREEEEESKKRTFKARPTPATLGQKAPIVKSTAASKARLSIAQGAGKADATRTIAGPVIRPVGRVSSVRSTTTNFDEPTSTPTATVTKPIQRRSVLGTASGNKRISTATITSSTVSNSTASKAPYIPSSSRLSMSIITPQEAARQKLRGKEVVNRGKEEREERERARKEKEEAARKARQEAAERGRIASREWAEKMRGKKEREKEREKEGKGNGGEVAVLA